MSFDGEIINSHVYILSKALTKKEFKETMGSGMTDVSDTAEPVVDIWDYIKNLVHENIVSEHVFKNNLVEKVYRNDKSSFEHILLPTNNQNIFIVIIVSLQEKNIFGHYHLDLSKEYLLGDTGE